MQNHTWEVITWAKYLSNKLSIWKLLQSPSMPVNRIRIGRWFSGSLLLTYQWTTGHRILFWKQYFRHQINSEIHCALQSSSLWFVISSRHFIHIHFTCAKVKDILWPPSVIHSLELSTEAASHVLFKWTYHFPLVPPFLLVQTLLTSMCRDYYFCTMHSTDDM